jgi:hypothetical protein
VAIKDGTIYANYIQSFWKTRPDYIPLKARPKLHRDGLEMTYELLWCIAV